MRPSDHHERESILLRESVLLAGSLAAAAFALAFVAEIFGLLFTAPFWGIDNPIALVMMAIVGLPLGVVATCVVHLAFALPVAMFLQSRRRFSAMTLTIPALGFPAASVAAWAFSLGDAVRQNDHWISLWTLAIPASAAAAAAFWITACFGIRRTAHDRFYAPRPLRLSSISDAPP